MNLRKFLTNISTMNVNISSQFVLFNIHFYGRNTENFLLKHKQVSLLKKDGMLYNRFIKDFIYNHIYNIFDFDTIGEIEFIKLSLIEYEQLENNVPSFIQIS
jgi:hypothetical protein